MKLYENNNFFNQFEILETWIPVDKLYGAILGFLSVVFLHFKTSPHLLQLFSGMRRCNFAVKLQTSASARDWGDNNSIFLILGWTYPFIIIRIISHNIHLNMRFTKQYFNDDTVIGCVILSEVFVGVTLLHFFTPLSWRRRIKLSPL